MCLSKASACVSKACLWNIWPYRRQMPVSPRCRFNVQMASRIFLEFCFLVYSFFYQLFNYIDFSQHSNKLTIIIFILYSYMFRLTWVIFRLEIYLFAIPLCSFWDPRRLHVFCIDVMYSYFIIIGGCNKPPIIITSNYNKVDNIYAKNL